MHGVVAVGAALISVAYIIVIPRYLGNRGHVIRADRGFGPRSEGQRIHRDATVCDQLWQGRVGTVVVSLGATFVTLVVTMFLILNTMGA